MDKFSYQDHSRRLARFCRNKHHRIRSFKHPSVITEGDDGGIVLPEVFERSTHDLKESVRHRHIINHHSASNEKPVSRVLAIGIAELEELDVCGISPKDVREEVKVVINIRGIHAKA